VSGLEFHPVILTGECKALMLDQNTPNNWSGLANGLMRPL